MKTKNYLAELKRRAPPFDFGKIPDGTLFTHLVGAIVSQQLSIKAASTIHGRFKALFANNLPTPEATLRLKIPTMRGVGLSEAKAKAILDLAAKALDGTVPSDEVARSLSDSELVERLVSVRGVGRWTVEMVLIFRYRRPDIWPVDDLGVRKGFEMLFPKGKLLEPGFKGKRTELAWYCWRVLEEKEKQTWQGVPLNWAGTPIMLWLKGGKPARLDFNRKTKAPKALWPGETKLTKHRQAHWQKYLNHALKKGGAWEDWEIEGTPFQQTVWRAINSIPHGETRSYAWLAAQVGKSKGFQAVAQACGANRLPLLIPCHRVVGTDGLGGFGGGLKLKKLFLKVEGVEL